MRLVHGTGALRKFRPQFGHVFNVEVRQIKPLKGFLVLKFAGVRVHSVYNINAAADAKLAIHPSLTPLPLGTLRSVPC